MRSGLPITDYMLEEAGIAKPGHRARILMKLDEESGLGPRSIRLQDDGEITCGYRCGLPLKRRSPKKEE